ncbi:hypothetical protein [Isoptericola dokdonensis]|uniref:hypothetical protein n=1 Tax=Isoptericola dokdonensis TaxID=372663 RepID=UPI00082C6B97|nr:hypothetical protein [Isoptericola dokdonensis]
METSPAGLAALALVVLWLGFWVPQQLRNRQVLADAGLDDRFSGGLRVLTMADGTDRRRGMTTGRGADAPASGAVPRVTAGSGVPGVAQQSRERTARLEVLERRAARARRRLTLTALLVLLTVAAWTVVALGYLMWPVALVPSVLLAVVLLLGRVAVVAARRSDARWRAERRAQRQRATQERTLAHGGPYAPRNRARITGLAVHPSDTSTQMIPRVQPAATVPSSAGRSRSTPAVAPEEPVAPETEPDPVGIPLGTVAVTRPLGGEPWEPVPVPLPTYVTKPLAPRPAVPLPPELSRPTAPAPAAREQRPAPVAPEPAQESLAGDEPRPRTETLGLPLEQILARRRAAG